MTFLVRGPEAFFVRWRSAGRVYRDVIDSEARELEVS
jgi:hypothetical protein